MNRVLRLALAALLIPAILSSRSLSDGSDEADTGADTGADTAGDTASGNGPETLTVPDVDLEFEVPEGWAGFEDAEGALEAGTRTEAFEEMAGRAGMEVEEFADQLPANTDLFVAAPHAEEGFLDNLNLISADDTEVPSLGATEAQLRAVGGDVTGSEKVRTNAGRGLLVDYILDVQDLKIYGTSVAVAVDGDVLTFTTSSKDVKTAHGVAVMVVESLTPSN